MAWAREHMHDAPHGSVFLADTFLHAHGRQGRAWHVLPGQILITLLLKPKKLLLEQLPALNMAISLGILEPFLAHKASLKWPNDFVLQGKKLGGMIMEVIWNDQNPYGVIVGFALNINTLFEQSHELFSTATSVLMVTGQQFDLEIVQRSLFSSLNRWYLRWDSGAYDQIFQFWRQQQLLVGTVIITHHKNGDVITGVVCDVLPDGALVLEVNDEKQVIQHYMVEAIR